jgi:TolA-binding protein
MSDTLTNDGKVARSPIPQPIAGLLLIIALLGLSVFVGRQEAPAAAAAPPAAAATPETPAPPATATPATEPAPAETVIADEVKGLKSQLDALSGELKTLRGKLDDLSEPAPAFDPKPIEGKVDDLSRSVAAVMPLSDKVKTIDKDLGGIDAEVKSAREEVSTLAAEVKKLADAKPAAPAPAPAAVGLTLTDGIDLFRAGKYREAIDAFKKYEAASPTDARAYYFEALASGLISGNWQGDAVKLAARGAEIEKTGATKAADIDAALADMPANLKSWIAYYRAQAR